MVFIGLDIGTTTISGIVIDAKSKKSLESITISNNSFIASKDSKDKLQDANIIYGHIERILADITKKYSDIASIGITGQMHGIVYLDENCNAISPLYTWQNERALKPLSSNKNSLQEIYEKTGYVVKAGYGYATHYYNTSTHNTPKWYKYFCTIHDFIVAKIAGLNSPIMHISDAASFGLYNVKENCFDSKAIYKLFGKDSYIPEVTKDNLVVGDYKGIPVSVAIGDNQASFLGSVSDIEKGLLVNVGTGSQISVCTKYVDGIKKCELRPLINDKYILVGCGLCGGRAYSVLENFFKEYIELSTNKNTSQYDIMNSIISGCDINEGLDVITAFAGTREDPNIRGSINNIDFNNFTPKNLIIGFIKGIINELLDYTKEIPNVDSYNLIGSGNGLRKNKTMCNYLEKKMNKKLLIPKNQEEASFGAAMFGAVSSGAIKDFNETKKYILYE